MAAVKFRRLTGSGSNTDATSYAMTSVTPTVGRPLVALIETLYSAPPTAITLSGTNGVGATWTTRNASLTQGNRRFQLLTSTPASGVAGVVTITSGGSETLLAAAWSLYELINVSSEVPVQVVINNGGSVTSLALTLAAFASPWNMTFAGFCTSAAFGSITSAGLFRDIPSGGATESAGDGVTVGTFFSPDYVASPTATFTSADAMGIGAEFTQDGSDISAGGTTAPMGAHPITTGF